MPLLVNVRHLEVGVVKLTGELPVEELDLDIRDEMIRIEEPLKYDFEIQKLESSLLLRGTLQLKLRCQCVRCLRSFLYELKLENWTRHLPFEGEDRVEVDNDLVDLTLHLREDILLEFPQHPLCEADCRGLLRTDTSKSKKGSDSRQTAREPSAWAVLDKLKL